MESRLYPTWEQLQQQNNPLTFGEKALIKYLDFYLPRDSSWKIEKGLKNYRGWLIFAQPFLNGTRPDIIIFNPYVGIVIYEVKDWNLDNYECRKGEGLFVNNGHGSYPVKSPIDQVEHYKEILIGQLVPNIGDAIDHNEKKFGLIKTGVYFHKAKTDDCRNRLGTRLREFKYFPFFGFDSLVESRLKEIVPDINIQNSYYWNREWNEDVLFWLIPPFHSIEQGTILKLRGNQIKVAEPRSGHYRVRGVAGSGKTQALAYRAGKLASQGYNVLIITFNITLWHYIKDMIARSPFAFNWDKFTFTHFHGFCKDKLNEFEQKWPKSPERNDFMNQEVYEEALEIFFKSTVPNAVTEAIRGNLYQKYDAILIDEGQDYHYEWYSMLESHFLNNRDEVLIVCDKRQNIFNRELDWLDKRVTRAGLDKFQEPYIDLTITFRLPKKVAVMANEFSEIFDLNQELKVGRIENNPVLFHSHHIVWLNIIGAEWQFYVYKAFLRLKKEGYSPSDMVILLPSHKMGKEAIHIFHDKKIEVNHVFEENTETRYHPHKRAFWMGDSRLKMSTIHSFKGWELLNIILFIPEKAPESNRKVDAIVYTALTRTRENVIILNANKRYNSFGDRFPKKWNEQ
ncbi:MAG: AAA family ATPase [Enterococcus sp.]|nr:AAA family ATPase [Enterococcus sp.]